MSYEFAEPVDRLGELVRMFLREATVILDESKPFPLRVALAVKWSHVLGGLGFRDRLRPEDATPRKVSETAMKMLEWVVTLLERGKTP